MKASLSWLKDYIAIDTDVDTLAEAMTMLGLEVEAVTDRYAYLNDVIGGKILALNPHPEADGLTVCQVDVGESVRTIVCGATNIKEGCFVPVALPGAVLPSEQKIEAGRIRGQVSEGMLCSEAELALGTDAAGILLLSGPVVVGQSVAKAMDLADPVFEFDLTPNRSDCLSMIGIAREMAAVLKTPLKHPEVPLPDGKDPITSLASVSIEAPDHCPRYAARLLWDISVGPSPFWLQDKLRSVGLRPISNIVDVTNFVMMEMGQPLHAFDFDRLAEHRIVVRTAGDGQTFTTLDGVKRQLPADALMICDGKAPVALAGIMGGLDSEIEDTTNRVLIESAYFNPITIRRTAKQLGLNTESSHRFERGVDPEGTIRAVDRAAALMLELTGGKMASGVIDAHPKPVAREVIEVSVRKTNRLLGTDLAQDQISEFLASVELDVVAVDGDRLKVTPPSFRVDLKRPEDLMEEVARLYGYGDIPISQPVSQIVTQKPERALGIREAVRDVLGGCGFSEIITYSFIGREQCDRLLLAQDDDRRRVVPILNPLTEDQDVMRTSLLPGVLATMYKNMTQRNDDLRIFELGKVFIATDSEPLPEETDMIAGLWTGARHHRSWHAKENPVDFYDMKGVVETLCGSLNIASVRFSVPESGQFPYFSSGRSAAVFAEDILVGSVGEVGPPVLKNYDLKNPAYCFDLNFDLLQCCVCHEKKAAPLSRFPETTRDMALILDGSLEVQSVLDFITSQNQPLIVLKEIFDIYTGEPIPDGKKSVALRFTYQSFERNLTDSEVNSIHESLIFKTLKQFDAQLPTK